MSSWDGYGGQIFPADIFHHQETLEAVLQQPLTTAGSAPLQAPAAAPPLAVVDGDAGHGAAAPRKRPFRTDRHSKIHTAQGVRDRRMRLSVGVAREFFALQDRLGFDKASKTVNWLLTQSKPAIDGLRRDAPAEPAAGFASPWPTTTVVKGGGEGSSSSTCCFDFKDPRGGKGRSRGGHDGPAAALMEEHGGGELDWVMSNAAAAVPLQPQPPPQLTEDEQLEYYYYQQYQLQLQLEEMMRCNSAGVPR
ncbi:hypothetical protein U9M48_038843 [Paspalum notatum var. saurae]|uniref:TCP domain-containing protein n=1 Tax=Paspalum notatum var. saurae TaxID=547442 RepID=A0AAQ3UIE5_PASNO